MLAAEYPIIEEAATHLAKISEDEYIRLQIQAREDQLIRHRELMDMLDEATTRANEAESRNITQIIKKLRKNKTPEQIAEELEEDDLERITAICGVINDIGLDHTDEEIVAEVLKAYIS